jgi:hypothetical protein
MVRCLVLAWAWIVGAAAIARGQVRPLETDTAVLLPVGTVRAQFGFEFLQNQRYTLSGLEGDLTRFGVAAVHVGVGEYAEFQLSGVVQDFLSVKRRTPDAPVPPDFAGNSSSDVGDIVLATKLRLAAERGSRPALAFKFAVALPNASNESGLGVDETRFFAGLLASKKVGRLDLTANAGLAILGSPVTPNSQSDMFTYGVAAAFPVTGRLDLVGEVAGREGVERIGYERRGQVRAGIRLRAAGLVWDAAGLAGLHHTDADSGVALGVRYEFQAFHKPRTPRTVK